MLGIAVTVVFQGNFEKDGYRLGRLAAGLYRMPPPEGMELDQLIEGEEPNLPQVGRGEVQGVTPAFRLLLASFGLISGHASSNGCGSVP